MISLEKTVENLKDCDTWGIIKEIDEVIKGKKVKGTLGVLGKDDLEDIKSGVEMIAKYRDGRGIYHLDTIVRDAFCELVEKHVPQAVVQVKF